MHTASALVCFVLMGAGDEAAPTGKLTIVSVSHKGYDGPKKIGSPSGYTIVKGVIDNTSGSPLIWSNSSVRPLVLRKDGKKWEMVPTQTYSGPDPVKDALLIEPGKKYEFSIEITERYGGFEAGHEYLLLLNASGQTTGFEFSR